MLSQLAVHYYRPDFSEGQAKSLIRDMVEDLSGYRVEEIEVAIRSYRMTDENKYFPRSGQLIKIIEEDRKDRRQQKQSQNQRPAIPSGPDMVAFPDGVSRPLLWWHQSKENWKSSWRESEVPVGELIRDVRGGPLRKPNYFAN